MEDFKTRRAEWQAQEPATKYTTTTSYCHNWDAVRCPDCQGHETRTRTKEWNDWFWSKPQPPKPERRNPLDHERCRALTLTTGQRCKQFADPADPDQYCGIHATTRDKAQNGTYSKLATRVIEFDEQMKH